MATGLQIPRVIKKKSRNEKLIFLLLNILFIYYAFYGLVIFLGPMDPMSLQNPNTDVRLKLIDELILSMVLFLLLIEKFKIKQNNLIVIILSSIVFLIVITLREMGGSSTNLLFFKSLLISCIVCMALSHISSKLAYEIFINFIHANILAVLISFAIFIYSPYLAYGGRLLGNYANPNTSSFVYLILFIYLNTFYKRFYRSSSIHNLLFWRVNAYRAIFLIGLITCLSKIYLALFGVYIIINRPMLVVGSGIITIGGLTLFGADIIPDLNLVLVEFFDSNTFVNRIVSFETTYDLLSDIRFILIGGNCDDCNAYVSDATIVNLVHYFGLICTFFIFAILFIPMILAIVNNGERYQEVNLFKHYLICCALLISSFFHYSLEIQPSQLLFVWYTQFPVWVAKKRRWEQEYNEL